MAGQGLAQSGGAWRVQARLGVAGLGRARSGRVWQGVVSFNVVLTRKRKDNE